jgi:alanine dehydrogenase
MSSLYELTGQIFDLKIMFEAGEIDEQTLTDTMESLDADIEVKAEGYCKIIALWSGDVASAKSEIDRLTEHKKTLENSVKRLKDNLQTAMSVQGKQKLAAGTFTVSIAKNPASVNVLCEELIPIEYFKTPDPVLVKKELLDALKAGTVVPGAELKQGESLRIK